LSIELVSVSVSFVPLVLPLCQHKLEVRDGVDEMDRVLVALGVVKHRWMI
jgi:hypothetical protein